MSARIRHPFPDARAFWRIDNSKEQAGMMSPPTWDIDSLPVAWAVD